MAPMELTEQHNPQNVKPCRPAGGFALVRSVLDDKDHRTAAVLLVSYLIEDAGGKSKGTRLSDRRGKIFYEDRYTIIAVQAESASGLQKFREAHPSHSILYISCRRDHHHFVYTVREIIPTETTARVIFRRDIGIKRDWEGFRRLLLHKATVEHPRAAVIRSEAPGYELCKNV